MPPQAGRARATAGPGSSARPPRRPRSQCASSARPSSHPSASRGRRRPARSPSPQRPPLGAGPTRRRPGAGHPRSSTPRALTRHSGPSGYNRRAAQRWPSSNATCARPAPGWRGSPPALARRPPVAAAAAQRPPQAPPPSEGGPSRRRGPRECRSRRPRWPRHCRPASNTPWSGSTATWRASQKMSCSVPRDRHQPPRRACPSAFPWPASRWPSCTSESPS
mmetsp:Transcript_78072/g.207180  ORF Transcript_78072/g.207180 Transcript_78072/m.207180 type:complete len:221 (-) Transcript_78072:235-897(-)